MLIQQNVPLAPLTTLGVGGPAQFFSEIHTPEDAMEAIQFARSRKLPVFVLGGGSNLVVADKGWPGLVLKVAISGIKIDAGGKHLRLEVGAGEDWDKLVAHAVGLNCSGIECLSGIPGSVGGTPVQNVGAYGQEVSETIQSVTALDLNTLEIRELSREDCGFSYRASIFNTSERGRYIVLKVVYALARGGAPKLAYADLQKYFVGAATPPTLLQVRDAVREIRAGKGMLISSADPDCRSAGSFFKNPVLSAEQFEELTRRASALQLKIPSYPALEARRKVSAAWLVENSGFKKGFGAGRAGISHKHALAIVNRGGATAAEILALKENIQQKVKEIWNVFLEPEPVLVGF